ncbi:MAG: TonB-dependent receptor [Acidobacteriia bacterium]|nr:TonB-dependent receptor [Terriglobia bacterium]
MKPFTLVSVVTLFAVCACAQQGTTPSGGQDTAALEQKVRDLEDRLIALEGQVRALKAQAGQAPAATPGTASTEAASQAPATVESVAAAPTPVSLGGAGGSAAKALNPDISMIGDFVAAAGGNSIRSSPALEMHESELGVQAIIDPYARGDFFLTFGETGVGLEEGYITFTALPGSFVARVGKMRSAFGKVNMMHNHVLPWVDRPLVSQNLVGGEDGIDDAGGSVERIIPFPKGIFLSATGQVFRGDSGEGDELVFQSHQKSDVSTVAHLRGYGDLNESTNVELGLSYARGHNELGTNFITSLYGVDATLRWKPLRRAIYHSFVGRSEFTWSQRQQAPFEQRAFGMYASGEYQFHRRWFVGGRYDWSDRSRDASLTDKGGSAILTYWPSEFSQIRGQYRFTDYAGNHKTNELLLQLLFSLGAHGAHPF